MSLTLLHSWSLGLAGRRHRHQAIAGGSPSILNTSVLAKKAGAFPARAGDHVGDGEHLAGQAGGHAFKERDDEGRL